MGPSFPLPLRERGRGEGVLVREVLTLSSRLVPTCHPRRFNRCHSGLFPLVLPDISPPVIPDVIHRESKGWGEGVPEGVGEARPSCEASPTEQKEKDPGFPLKTCGNDKWGRRE